jgi:hypothetical protein
MKKIRENTAQVLALADELARGTIEKQMAMSDLELGRETLMKPDPLQRRRSIGYLALWRDVWNTRQT